jgi:hypothetical protein
MSKPPVGVLPGIQCPRRSNRKTTTFPIWLRSEELGPIWEEETETQTVSRCGAGLRCRHLVSAESMVVIVRRDTGRRAKARVRYSRFNPDGKRELGIEFIDNDNFWGLDWNSSELIDSQPEQIRTPSGRAQMREAILPAEIGKVEPRRSTFDVSPQLNSSHFKKKPIDLQLLQEEGFVFTEDGRPVGTPAQTLKQFVSSLTNYPSSVFEGHAHRGDFSQWIAGAFQDQFLASEIRKLEQRYRQGHVQGLCNSLARLIEDYCEFSDEPKATPSTTQGALQPISGITPDKCS